MWDWLVKFFESGAPAWLLPVMVIIVVAGEVIKAALKMSAEQIDAWTRRWLAKQWGRRGASWWARLKMRLLGPRRRGKRDG